MNQPQSNRALLIAVALAVIIAALSVASVVLLNGSDTATILAFIWTAASALGFVTTIWTWRDAIMEQRALEERDTPDQVLWSIALGNVRREAYRAIELLAFLVIAVTALLGLPNPLVSRALIVYILGLLIANSVLDRLERRQTLRLILRRRLSQEPP